MSKKPRKLSKHDRDIQRIWKELVSSDADRTQILAQVMWLKAEVRAMSELVTQLETYLQTHSHEYPAPMPFTITCDVPTGPVAAEAKANGWYVNGEKVDTTHPGWPDGTTWVPAEPIVTELDPVISQTETPSTFITVNNYPPGWLESIAAEPDEPTANIDPVDAHMTNLLHEAEEMHSSPPGWTGDGSRENPLARKRDDR